MRHCGLCSPAPRAPSTARHSRWYRCGRYLKKRTGIVRVAAEADVQLVPSYVFGQTQLFDQLATSKGWAADLSRRMRMSLTIFWGKFGLPIPHPAPVSMVFGQPIAMTGDAAVDIEVRPRSSTAAWVVFGSCTCAMSHVPGDYYL